MQRKKKHPNPKVSTPRKQGAEFRQFAPLKKADEDKMRKSILLSTNAVGKAAKFSNAKRFARRFKKTKPKVGLSRCNEPFGRLDQDDYDTFVQEAEADIPVIKRLPIATLRKWTNHFLGKKNQSEEDAFIEMMKNMNSKDKEK